MIYYLGPTIDFTDKIKPCTEKDILEYCNSKTILGLDTETQRKFTKGIYKEDIYRPGLDPYVSKICMIQIGDLENQFIIDTRFVDPIFLRDILESEKILKILHNSKFDYKQIRINTGMVLKNIWDTMLCERILYNGENISYSLESLMKRHLNYNNKEVDNLFTTYDEVEEEYDYLTEVGSLDFEEKKYVDKSIRANFVEIGDRLFTEKEIEYGATDVTAPLEIYNLQIKGRELSDGLYLPTKAFEIENKVALALGKIELRGICVNKLGWKELYEKNNKTYFDKKSRLDNWVVKYFKQFSVTDLFNDNSCTIDWKSPKEVIKFARYLNICPKEKSKFTGKIEWSVGAKAMFKLLNNTNKDRFYKNEELDFIDEKDTQAFILNFLLLKKYQQLTTTFGLDWLRFIHPVTGRVHTNFIQLMNTGY